MYSDFGHQVALGLHSNSMISAENVTLQFEATGRRLGGRMPILDGIRGMAILLVLGIHFGNGSPAAGRAGRLLAVAAGVGWVGVDLFFVLSGFLITGILVDTRLDKNYFTSFYARRVLRIMPLYYSFLVLWFFVMPLTVGYGGPLNSAGQDQQLWYWAYIPNWLPLGKEVPLLTHFWSLGVEEQYYLIWPLLVWLLPERRVGVLCLTMIVAAPFIRWWMLATGSSWFCAYALTPARMDSLAFGGLVAVALRDRRWFRVVLRGWMPALAVAVAGILALANFRRGLPHWARPVQLYGYSFLALGFAALIAAAVLGQGKWYQRALSAGWLRSFGRYSYAIYVLHVPICYGSLDLLARTSLAPALATPAGRTCWAVGGVALSYGSAIVSWHLLERHFIALKRHFVPERERARP